MPYWLIVVIWFIVIYFIVRKVIMVRECKICGKVFKQYSSLQNKCYDCTRATYKPIAQKGPKTIEYENWRDNVAKPYLDKKFGHKCALCGSTVALEVDHIKKRSTTPEMKQNVLNVRYLCEMCHYERHHG